MSSSSKAFERENYMQDSVEDVPYQCELDYFQEDKSFCESDLLFYEELQILAHFGALDDLYLDKASPPFQACRDGFFATPSSNKAQDWQPNEEKRPYAFPSAAMEILRHYRSRAGAADGGLERDEGKRQSQRASPPTLLSVSQLIELAVRSFIHSNSENGNDFHLSAVIHQDKTPFSSLSRGESEDIRLVQDLLSCARAVCNHRYACASELLKEFSKLSSGSTNVMQRLVYCFAESLRDKIEIETRGSVNTRPLQLIPPISATASFIEKLHFNQVMQFAGVQAVLDHLSSRRKVHVVDFGLYGGLRHSILMQALATSSERPLQHLKITAVATQSNLLTEEEAGARLENLAKSLNLSFSFHVISFEDILSLQQSVLRLDPEETVVVQAAHALRFMIPKLENLMTVIRSIDPHVMIITEVEANVDSPVFVNRFVEALFYFGAGFDYLQYCLKDDLAARAYVESKLYSPSIRHIVAAEEEERKFRFVGINFWRETFARFGMEETELSKLALNHANSVLNKFDCRDSCKLGLNGNTLIVGWKDTPIFSLSAWKFQKIRTI
ncbi:DELLA protein RGL1-like [Salvia miltiorrhiza]|uniref:DELLA protein RGL1-like n=1 Tax=Salvia miltiorrhiza TaxID=226208 RepID=UPI0025ABA346|nr:DELLA protein RGL1-like [Salvia miltiorrhiza]